MGKVIVFRIITGNFRDGFPISLEIAEDNVDGITHPFVAIGGKLPPNPILENLYRNWQQSYRHLGMQMRLGASKTQITNISYESAITECKYKAEELRKRLLNWYNSQVYEFAQIREKLFSELNKNESARILVQTEEASLRLLPWHLFFESFLETYPQAEVALSPINYGNINLPKCHRKSIRILGILGSSEGIDIETDKQTIASLPDAEPHFLISPNINEVTEYLYQQEWDLLFFAGHSSSQNKTGQIKINSQDSISINELKNALTKAVQKGLRLAIFNSCDGLELARALEELHLPQVIVMREMVPDKIAQAFLKQFLTTFSQGESLYLAVREAREKLQPLEKDFPCATWLPVICQNPATLPLTWHNLHNLDFYPNLKRNPTSISIPNNLDRVVLLKGIGKATVVVEYNNLTNIKADVLVNPDDIYISMAGRVSAALLEIGGKVIKEEIERRIPQELGKVTITTAGNLAAENIFHAVVIDYEKPEETNVNLIQKITRRCLELAEIYEVKKIAFPALAIGGTLLSPEKCAVAMIIEIVKYLGGNTSLEKVTIALLDEGKGGREDLIRRFYTKVSDFLDMYQQMETRRELLLDLERIYRSLRMESAVNLILRYQAQLDSITRQWTEEMLGVNLSEVIEQKSVYENAYENSLAKISKNVKQEERRVSIQNDIDLNQSFNTDAAAVWEKIQAAENEEEIREILTSLQGDIDSLAWINDRFELDIASIEAKLKKVKDILSSQLIELKQGQKVLHEELVNWHGEGVLENKTSGEERVISFKSYPKLELLVSEEDLPSEYRTEKVSYSAKKKELKNAGEKGIDISKWAKIDPNLKVKFGFKSKN